MAFSVGFSLKCCEMSPIVRDSWGSSVVCMNRGDASEHCVGVGKRCNPIEYCAGDGDENFLYACIGAGVV